MKYYCKYCGEDIVEDPNFGHGTMFHLARFHPELILFALIESMDSAQLHILSSYIGEKYK